MRVPFGHFLCAYVRDWTDPADRQRPGWFLQLHLNQQSKEASKCEEEKEEEEREKSKLVLTLPVLFPFTVRSTRLDDQNGPTDYINTVTEMHQTGPRASSLLDPTASKGINKQANICHYNNWHIDWFRSSVAMATKHYTLDHPSALGGLGKGRKKGPAATATKTTTETSDLLS